MRLTTWLLLASLGTMQAATPRRDVVRRICASDMGQGEMARVDVLLTAAGLVKVLVLRPDIRRVSHGPHTYFDADGTTLLVVAERPLAPGEAATDPVQARLRALTAGLRPGKAVYCSTTR